MLRPRTRGRPPAQESGSLNSPPPRVVRGEVPCLSCGYNLDGLEISGLCPECAAPVDRSLQGNLLRYSSEDFVQRLHRGALIEEIATLTSLLASVTLIIVMIATQGSGQIASASNQVQEMLKVALSCLSMYGIWLFTSPEPGHVDRRVARLRIAARWSAAIVAITTVGAYVLGLYGFGAAMTATVGTGMLSVPADIAPLIIGLVVIASLIVRFFASLNYLAMVANRVPDDALYGLARQYRWLCPLLFFPGVLICGIGPLIAFIVYIQIIDRTRRAMKSTLATIRADRAASSPRTA